MAEWGCLYPAVSVAGSAPTACQVPSKLSTALSSASHLLLLLLPGTHLQHSPSMSWHREGVSLILYSLRTSQGYWAL